ncbi:MAG: polyphosphate kinase 2 family protein [Candidatus Kapabacteria bacterium]|nr:polyphosphate kinase 2 family protein [Candidatus Kapabacteria bacterium]
MNINTYRFDGKGGISLDDYRTDDTGGYTKESSRELLQQNIERMATLQDTLYAQNIHAMLIIIQAMDAAGKDSLVKHVMSGLNPQGVHVTSFKQPSAEELDHDYMWRAMRAMPERGRIGIFNRSYYEEVLVVRVHPELLNRQQLPPVTNHSALWKQRFNDICSIEQYLENNSIHVVKLFLHVSKDEQKKRFMERINDPAKNWKFSAADISERGFWDEYQNAYTEMIEHTSTKHAPWYILPADNKWFTRLLASEIIIQRLNQLNLQYPVLSNEQKKVLEESQRQLQTEYK